MEEHDEEHKEEHEEGSEKEHEEKTESEDKQVLPASKKGSLMSIEPVLKYIEKNDSKIFSVLLGVLLIIFVLNISFTSVANITLNEKAELIEEANKPIKIELSIIDCFDCFDIESVVDSIKSQNVDVLNEEILDISEAQDLILKYNIQTIPSVLISGEIDSEKIDFKDFRLSGDALIFDKVNAPFLDLSTNTLKGKVVIKEIVDSSCEDCSSLASFIDGFAQSGILIESWNKIEYDSIEAKNLISQFGLDKVPTVLISDDIDYYDGMKETLTQISTEKEGYYIISAPVPPYRDLVKKKVVGLVDLILIDDESCSDCYDVETNKQILAGFRMVFQTEETYDVSSPEAQALISKYNIQKVPMIILSPDAGEYDSFVSAWENVGTEESDGWFVMTNPEIVGEIKEI